MGIPDSYTWSLVMADVGALLDNVVVRAGVSAAIALMFAPAVIAAARYVIGLEEDYRHTSWDDFGDYQMGVWEWLRYRRFDRSWYDDD